MTTVEASVVETAAADRRLQQAGLGLALRETRTSRAEGEGRGVAMHYEERDEDLDLAILVARMNDRGLRSASVFADRLIPIPH